MVKLLLISALAKYGVTNLFFWIQVPLGGRGAHACKSLGGLKCWFWVPNFGHMGPQHRPLKKKAQWPATWCKGLLHMIVLTGSNVHCFLATSSLR